MRDCAKLYLLHTKFCLKSANALIKYIKLLKYTWNDIINIKKPLNLSGFLIFECVNLANSPVEYQNYYLLQTLPIQCL